MQPTRYETLERRTLFSADPAVLMNLTEASLGGDNPDFGGSRGTAVRVPLTAMMQTRVAGQLSDASDVDMLRVDLNAGQFFGASLDGVEDGEVKMTMYDARARRVKATSAGELFYRVPRSGRYYVRLSNMDSDAPRHDYTLDLRPIGLSAEKSDPKLLQANADGMYAVRNGRELHITGPTGHGFTLLSDWRQQTTSDDEGIGSVYTAANSLTLRSIVGDVTLPVPKGTFVRITTELGQYGRHFGEIESIDFGIKLGPMELAKPFGNLWGSSFDNSAAGFNLNAGGWGIALGSDPLLKTTDLPLSPNVPYLFYTDNRGFTANFGGLDVNVKGSVGYSVVVDPADAFFLGAKGVPVVGDVAFGMSSAGVIPFTPSAPPAGLSGKIFGNVYIKGGLDISAIAPTIPVNVEGDVFIDVDANNDGKNFGGYKANVSRLLAAGFGRGSALTPAETARVFGDIDIGVNGGASVGYEKGAWELSVPVAEGTFVYSGTRQGLFARGRSVNPLAGTPLAVLGSRGSLDIDAQVYRSGTFRVAATGTYRPGPFTVNGSLVVDNAGARLRGTAGALGTRVMLSGSVLPDGRFTLSGRANVNLGPLRGSGSFTLRNTNRAVTFGAAFNARLATHVLGVEVGGRVNANLSFRATNRGLTYSGRGSAALFAGSISVGPHVAISNRNLAIGIDLGLLGKPTINVPLPA